MISATSSKTSASSGGFEGPKGNTDPKLGAFVKPLEPKTAIEMQYGKKYICVLKLDRVISQNTIADMHRSLGDYERRLRENGIDITFILTQFAGDIDWCPCSR